MILWINICVWEENGVTRKRNNPQQQIDYGQERDRKVVCIWGCSDLGNQNRQEWLFERHSMNVTT